MTSAVDLSSEVRSGLRTASGEAAEALTRIGDDPLNAFTHLTDRSDLQPGLSAGRGKLAGVPIALKDLIDQAHSTTTCGSSFYRETPADSATIVTRLIDEGASIVGRTGLHEFAFGFSSENQWFGPVRNPWDEETSPGGSSGGSAVAVAAGHVPIAIGTDTGGSVRVPAALCGIFGLKVTHGRIPLSGVFPLAPSLDTVGPLARTVGDLALAYSVLRGYDRDDPWSAVPPPQAQRPGRIRRIGVPQRWIDAAPVTEEVMSAFERALNALSDSGYEVVDVDHSLIAAADEATPAAYAEVAAVHRRWFREGKEYGPEVGARIEEALGVTMEDFAAARAWTAALGTATAEVFESVDVLVTPTVGAMRKLIGVDTITVGDADHHYRSVLACFTALVNHMRAPALVMPLNIKGSPPPSLQVIGPKWSESQLLAFGRELETSEIVGCAPRPPI